MIDFLLHALLTSFAIVGLHTTAEEGMVFEKPADWLYNHLPKWLGKPLIGCPPCMASIWGTASFVFLHPPVANWMYLGAWLFFILTVCGMNNLIHSLTK